MARRYAYARATRTAPRYRTRERRMTQPKTAPMPMTKRKTRYPIVPFGFRGSKPFVPILRGLRRNRPNPLTPRRMMPDGTGSSFSNFAITFKPRYRAKLLGQLSAVDRYYRNDVQILNVADGRQLWQYDTIGNSAHLFKMMSLALQQNANIFSQDATGLNTVQKQYNAILIRSMEQVSTWTNQTSSSMFLYIYEVVPRYNLVEQSSTLGTGGASLVVYNPVACMDAMNATAGQGAAAFVGVQPTYSQLFTTNYRILRTYTVELAQGRTHQHKSVYNINKVMRSSEIDTIGVQTSTNQFLFKNYSRVLMYRAYGQVVDNNLDSVVTTSPGQIDYCSTKRFSYSGISDFEQSQFFDNNLQTGQANLEVLNIGTGTAIPITSA